MDKETMKRIIRDCGYSPFFQERTLHSAHAQNREVSYVFAYRLGIQRSLGPFHVVAALSEDALRAHVASKFARAAVTRRKQ